MRVMSARPRRSRGQRGMGRLPSSTTRRRSTRAVNAKWRRTERYGSSSAGFRSGDLSEPGAVQLAGALLDAGAWFPFGGAEEFVPWARSEELLD